MSGHDTTEQPDDELWFNITVSLSSLVLTVLSFMEAFSPRSSPQDQAVILWIALLAGFFAVWMSVSVVLDMRKRRKSRR